ncbi:MAG: hypothetical protein GY699_08210 [Desulfobacteraceae bacterium]|nr:hypothetical protein [Desulfobacteraceae bacterium]
MGKELVTEIFIRYFKTLSEKNGVCFDADMSAEIEYAVEVMYRDAVFDPEKHLGGMASN